MKERYMMIVGGGIFLLLAVVLLIFSQIKPKGSTEVAPNLIPTATVPLTFTASPTSGASFSSAGMVLSVLEPANNAVVANAQILIRGKTAPNAEVFINEKELLADDSGNFSTTLTLDEGENLIIVTANDSGGNMAEKELTVTYNAAE